VHYSRFSRPSFVACAVSIALLLGVVPIASAEHEHTVQQGQSLGAIAKKYGVSVFELAMRNRLKQDAVLRKGQVLVVPSQGVVYVQSGQTLAGIARRRQVDPIELAKRNGLKPGAALKVGQRLVLPGFDDEGEADDARKRWGTPKHPGVVTLYRIWSKQTRHIRLLDSQGRARNDALTQLRDLMRPRESRMRKTPHPRLLRLISQVSDHFGGRPLHVVSGYRLPGGYTRESSRHVAGEAIDFLIPGVPLTEVRDYCLHFDHSGCGYYPRSGFVHMDVRRKNAHWTDWSLPGQAPILTEPKSGAAQPPANGEKNAEPKDEADPTADDDGLPALDDDLTDGPPAR
jgi:uncharacterized protein YcbK (DUF882 family)